MYKIIGPQEIAHYMQQSNKLSAAVLEPGGLNVYWSEKHRDGGGWSRAG